MTTVETDDQKQTKEAAWHERGLVLLEQVDAICKRGRERQLTYMQAVYELENLRIGKHLESKPRLSSITASRAVIQYQTLLKLLDQGRALVGWGQEHESLMVEALDIAFFRMSDYEHALYERKTTEGRASGHIARCSDPYYTEELTQLVARAFDGARLAGRELRTVFAMGTYRCPANGEHRGHAPAVCAGDDDEPLAAEERQFLSQSLRRFADDLDAQLAEQDEASSGYDAAAAAQIAESMGESVP